MPPGRAADFQAAWYLSLIAFGIVLVVAAGLLLGERMLGTMWRSGDRALALLVGTAVTVAGLFFTLLLVTVAVGLAPAAVTGGR